MSEDSSFCPGNLTPIHVRGNVSWMSGRYGLMVHYLLPGPPALRGPTIDDINSIADQFDVAAFVSQCVKTGADWLIFTFGQNSGNYASPNATIEGLCGPGLCTRRDLVLEIATSAHNAGLRFIGYLPCEINANPLLHAGFGWNNAPGTDQRTFQERYTRAVAEWGERFGRLMDGWWFDGCYGWDAFDNRWMNWSLWYASARAGNPHRGLAFNDGSFCCGNKQPIRSEHDYTAGEVEALVGDAIRLGRPPSTNAYLPSSQFVPGTSCQWHALIPIDCYWTHRGYSREIASDVSRWNSDLPYRIVDDLAPGDMEGPVYSNDQLARLLKHCSGVGGALTFNIGVSQEGILSPQSVELLATLRK